MLLVGSAILTAWLFPLLDEVETGRIDLAKAGATGCTVFEVELFPVGMENVIVGTAWGVSWRARLTSTPPVIPSSSLGRFPVMEELDTDGRELPAVTWRFGRPVGPLFLSSMKAGADSEMNPPNSWRLRASA